MTFLPAWQRLQEPSKSSPISSDGVDYSDTLLLRLAGAIVTSGPVDDSLTRGSASLPLASVINIPIVNDWR